MRTLERELEQKNWNFFRGGSNGSVNDKEQKKIIFGLKNFFRKPIKKLLSNLFLLPSRCVSLSEVKVLKQPQSPSGGGVPPYSSGKEKAQVFTYFPAFLLQLISH
jgi:hypothetical protein